MRYRVMIRCPEGWQLNANPLAWQRRYLNVTWDVCASEAEAYEIAATVPRSFVVSQEQYEWMPAFHVYP